MKIEKILSENDVGQTGSHQAGILLPKSGASEMFPELGGDIKNPRVEFAFVDADNATWSFTAIYYNSRLYEGTRNEYRLTGVTAFIRHHELSSGDVLILERNGADAPNVSYRKVKFTSNAIPQTPQAPSPITPFSVLPDVRSKSLSAMTQMSVEAYLALAEKAYENQGGITGQRQALTTTTAKQIRSTMVDDLTRGTILPPLVVGVLVSEECLEELRENPATKIPEVLSNTEDHTFSIIDGMQRTTALLELPLEFHKERFVRIEFWFTASTRSMVYRMLVLNTGQVPWTLRRQIEVVFEPLLNELEKDHSDVKITQLDHPGQHRAPGEFSASNVVELFLVFGARKEKVDTKEKLAEEFTKLDLLQVTSRELFTAGFTSALDYLAKFDILLSEVPEIPAVESGRFRRGSDLFDSQPARVGFMTAISLQIFGRPGLTKSQSEQAVAADRVFARLDELLNHLSEFSVETRGEFLSFPMLNEILAGKKPGKVGDFEREFFTKAFATLFGESSLVSDLAPCWRAF